MTVPFRIIDSGIREGRAQIAYDQALVELHGDGRVPDTLRFLRFPPTALIGRHQIVSHELNLEHCVSNGIGIVRRITGGGAIYLDENQVGWELMFDRRHLPMHDLATYTETICDAVAAGLSRAFGIDARFRPRNDIEVNGRKLCGTGGFFDGNTLIYQGTVLVDVDPAAMMACLNVPEAKLAKRNLDKPEHRITTLQELLDETPSVAAVHSAIVEGLQDRLGVTCTPGEMSDEEVRRSKDAYDEDIGTDDFVYEIDAPKGPGFVTASHTGAGGTITVLARLDRSKAAPVIREIMLTGDFFVTPPRTILDLEAGLRGLATADAPEFVDRFFTDTDVGMISISAAEFRSVIEAALTGTGQS